MHAVVEKPIRHEGGSHLGVLPNRFHHRSDFLTHASRDVIYFQKYFDGRTSVTKCVKRITLIIKSGVHDDIDDQEAAFSHADIARDDDENNEEEKEFSPRRSERNKKGPERNDFTSGDEALNSSANNDYNKAFDDEFVSLTLHTTG